MAEEFQSQNVDLNTSELRCDVLGAPSSQLHARREWTVIEFLTRAELWVEAVVAIRALYQARRRTTKNDDKPQPCSFFAVSYKQQNNQVQRNVVPVASTGQ